ncbi:MAG: 4Fe-4S binding protein, partial [Candidatus Hodarchaeota archaeon]
VNSFSKFCHKKTIALLETGPQVDQDQCIGCGLCVEKCPKEVFILEPREIIFDRQIGKIVDLPSQAQ